MKRKKPESRRGQSSSAAAAAAVRAGLPVKPCFRASVNPTGEFELLIYEEIGQDWWSDSGITAKNVRQELDSAGTFNKIVLRINSPGGDAFEGIAIGNVLKSLNKPIDVYIDGIAASAASIIAMCGNTVTMAHNAMQMIHNAWAICIGEAADMQKMGDTLDKISGSIAQTYVDKTGKPLAEIKAMMDAETWMSAEDCLANGFATSIAEQPNEPAMAMAKGFKVLGKMKKVPDALKNAVEPAECACECTACMDGECEDCTNADCNDVNCEDCPMQESAGGAADSATTVDASAEATPPPDAAVAAEVSNSSLFDAEQWMTERGISLH